jgi:hypothetical protein
MKPAFAATRRQRCKARGSGHGIARWFVGPLGLGASSGARTLALAIVLAWPGGLVAQLPTVTSLSPTAVPLGATSIWIEVQGSGFTSLDRVCIGGGCYLLPLPTTFVSSGLIRGFLGQLPEAANVFWAVVDRSTDPGCISPQAVVAGTFTVTMPSPVIHSALPSCLLAGSGDTPVRLTGSGLSPRLHYSTDFFAPSISEPIALVSYMGSGAVDEVIITVPAIYLAQPGTLSLRARGEPSATTCGGVQPEFWSNIFTIPIVGAPSVTLRIDQDLGLGSVRISNSCGAPGHAYFTAITTNPGNQGAGMGTGWWGGLHIGLDELFHQYSIGSPPFFGVLDTSGASLWTLPAGTLPPSLSGVSFFAVTRAFAPAGLVLTGTSQIEVLAIP